jgi:multiple sugar transport system permease protein
MTGDVGTRAAAAGAGYGKRSRGPLAGLRRALRRTPYYVVLVLVMVVIVFPYYWLVTNGVKTAAEIGAIPPRLVPSAVSLDSLKAAFATGFLVNMLNSIVISTTTAVACIFLGSFTAYAFGRIRMKGYKVMLGLILVLAMLPGISVLGPVYRIFAKLRMLNTYLALILPYAAFNMPFSIWYLANFFKAIPMELEEAAMIDGCTPFQAMIRIIFPMSVPALVGIGILSFIGAWNEFLFALCLTQTNAARTATVAIMLFQGVHYFPWGPISAASAFMSLPILVIVLISQRWLVRNLFTGMLKG